MTRVFEHTLRCSVYEKEVLQRFKKTQTMTTHKVKFWKRKKHCRHHLRKNAEKKKGKQKSEEKEKMRKLT